MQNCHLNPQPERQSWMVTLKYAYIHIRIRKSELLWPAGGLVLDEETLKEPCSQILLHSYVWNETFTISQFTKLANVSAACDPIFIIST